jgi:Rad3-related DNA helicase
MIHFDFLFYGVNVSFPRSDPYPAQKALMSTTIKALEKHENAILESPTGTGKTLALLASSLAYQEKITEEFKLHPHNPPFVDGSNNLHPNFPLEMLNALFREDPPGFNINPRKKVPAIWYTTRTHSQMKQLVSELRKLSYVPQLSILASRQHYCIYEKVAS